MFRNLHAAVQMLGRGRRGWWFLLGLVFVVDGTAQLWQLSEPPNSDGILYLSAAKLISSGDFRQALHIYPMPAYPALIALAHLIVPDWPLAGRLVSMLGLILSTLLLYRIAQRLFDSESAFWGSVAFALTPFQVEMAVLVYRDPVYLAFFAGAVLLMIEGIIRPSRGRVFGAAWFGLACALFRIEGIFLTPIFLAHSLWVAVTEPGHRRQLLEGSMLSLFAAVILGGAFYLMHGSAYIGFGRLDQFWSAVSDFDEVHRNYNRIQAGLHAIEMASPIPSQEMNFGEIARTWYWVIYLLGLIHLIFRVIGWVNLVPLYFGLKSGWGASRKFVLTVFVSYCLVLFWHLVTADYSGDRFVFAAGFLLYPWIGAGIARLATCVAHWPSRRFVIITIFYIFILGIPFVNSIRKMNVDDLAAVEAGHWLARSQYRAARMIGNDVAVAYEAGIPIYDESIQYRRFNPKNRNFEGLEKIALEDGRSVIILKIRKTKLYRLPRFARFVEVKRFSDKEKVVFIFEEITRSGGDGFP